MSIVLLTYNHPHRKTYDVLCRMIAGGHSPSAVLATPWFNRKGRDYLYGHRPAEKNWACEPIDSPKVLCENFRVPFVKVERSSDSAAEPLAEALAALQPSVVVVGGAGILPKSVVTQHPVVNVHPGLLPARRGLDVFKWCIHDLVEVGVTAHVCDEHTDLGRRLIERKVPVFPEDSFHSFAMRQYEYELGTINGAIEMVLSGVQGERIHPSETRPFRRMPKKIEAGLMQRFEEYKRVYS